MKYCKNCGSELPDDAVFCGACGVRQDDAPADDASAGVIKEGPEAIPASASGDVIEVSSTSEQVSGNPEEGSASGRQGKRVAAPPEEGYDPYVTKNVMLGKDGKYRWVYELGLFKNPTILFTLWKVFGITIAIVGIIFFIIELFDSRNFGFVLQMVGILIGIFFVLSLIGYAIYAAAMGGKYCVVFTMDDYSITHEQMPNKAKRASVIGDLLVLAGALAGQPSMVGVGVVHGNRSEMKTSFKSVKKLIAVPKRDLIKISAGLEHNQVYVESDDFNFVWNFIKSRCDGAEITEKF